MKYQKEKEISAKIQSNIRGVTMTMMIFKVVVTVMTVVGLKGRNTQFSKR